MRAITIAIPPRLAAITMPGNLPGITFQTELAPLMFRQRLGAITIPLFPPTGDDINRLMAGNEEFLMAGNGDTLVW